MIDTVLALVGLGVIVLAVIFLILPKVRDVLLKQREPEQIKAFGLELKISLFTLVVLVGIALIVPAIFFRYRDKNIADLESENKSLKSDLQRARIQSATMLVTLEGTDIPGAQVGKVEDLRCKYTFLGDNVERNAEVSKGYASGQYRLRLDDVTADRTVAVLTIEDAATSRRWSQEFFSPLEPGFVLKKVP